MLSVDVFEWAVQIVSDPIGAQTARRSLALLRMLARSGRPLTISDFAAGIGANRSAVYRLVRMLQAEEFLARDPEGRSYMVGNGLVAFASMIMRGVSLRKLAMPMMQRLSKVYGETVSLHVLSGRERVCVEVIDSTFPIRWVVPLGEALPVHSGTSGKVMLAFLSDVDLAAALTVASTAGEDVSRIRKLLREAHEKGYLMTIGDRHPGVAGLSAAVFNSHGVAGALTVSGPAERWTLKAMRSAAHEVKSEADLLSTMLGGHLPAEVRLPLGNKRRAS
jgi:DNA-binding IclR family transcriptional regulator